MGQSGPDIMTRPIALCWAGGGQVGSECGTDAGFVRTRGIRQELHGGVK